MKAFTSAAVFGLVPVPPMPPTASRSAVERCSNNDIVPDSTEHLDAPPPAHPERGAATERMATKDELAHIRHELDVSVD